MTAFYEKMTRFFKEDGWHIQTYEDTLAIRLPFKGNSGAWACIGQTQEEGNLFVFYSVCPKKVEKANLLSVVEFLTLANFNMLIGNFEMDMNDGEIRFRTSVGFGPSAWLDDLIKVAVYNNVYTMDKFLPGLMQVIEGTALPKDSIAMTEL